MNDKLKDMISSIINSTDSFLRPQEIASKVNTKFGANSVTDKQVNDFLQNEFYPEDEFKDFERRHRGFDGTYYM